MGFLAVAYFGKASPATVATALALAYASSGATSAWIGRTGRKAAVTMATMGIGMGFLAVNAQTHAIFATSAMAGILLGFRDQQTIQTLAWMPIRAIKKGGSSMQTLIASSIFSSIVMATGLFIAGTLIDRAPSAQAWIGLSATALLVPMAVLDIPGRRRRRTTQIPDLNVKQRERWLVTLTAAYHAATLTCHRIFIPLALLAIARQIGIQGHNLALIGLCLGIMGVLANFLPIERMTGAHPMITGARGAALSWLLIALGASPWLRPQWVPHVSLPAGSFCRSSRGSI